MTPDRQALVLHAVLWFTFYISISSCYFLKVWLDISSVHDWNVAVYCNDNYVWFNDFLRCSHNWLVISLKSAQSIEIYKKSAQSTKIFIVEILLFFLRLTDKLFNFHKNKKDNNNKLICIWSVQTIYKKTVLVVTERKWNFLAVF